MTSILFICSANRFRSVIAAEYFRFMLKQKSIALNHDVSSAGVWAMDGEPPVRPAVHFGKTRTLDLENIRARGINHQILSAADLIIVMAQGQKEAISVEFPEAAQRVFLLSEVCTGEVYDIPDPMWSVDDTPEVVGTEICSLLDVGLDNILKTASQIRQVD